MNKRSAHRDREVGEVAAHAAAGEQRVDRRVARAAHERVIRDALEHPRRNTVGKIFGVVGMPSSSRAANSAMASDGQ